MIQQKELIQNLYFYLTKKPHHEKKMDIQF